MSLVTIETRMCDQCETQMSAAAYPAWMTLTFPNQGVDSPEFDFCTYECLENWVNDDDDESVPYVPWKPGDAPVVAEGLEDTFIEHETNAADPAPEPPAALRPMMTLADAIANGLKPE